VSNIFAIFSARRRYVFFLKDPVKLKTQGNCFSRRTSHQEYCISSVFGCSEKVVFRLIIILYVFWLLADGRIASAVAAAAGRLNAARLGASAGRPVDSAASN